MLTYNISPIDLPKDYKRDIFHCCLVCVFKNIFTYMTELKNSGEKSSRSLESNQTKIKNKNCRPGFIESVHEYIFIL